MMHWFVQRALVIHLKNSELFKVYVTVTGLSHYQGGSKVSEGDVLLLIPEPENEFDENAVAVYCEQGKVGYVANSRETVRENTVFAYQLTEYIHGNARARVIEKTYRDFICLVEDTLNIDNVCLKAYDYYNNCDYRNALELFMLLVGDYNTLFVNQHIADCLIKLNRFSDAKPYIEKALSLDAENIITLMMQGFVMEKTDMPEEALEAYFKVQQIKDCPPVKEAIKNVRTEGSNEIYKGYYTVFY